MITVKVEIILLLVMLQVVVLWVARAHLSQWTNHNCNVADQCLNIDLHVMQRQ